MTGGPQRLAPRQPAVPCGRPWCRRTASALEQALLPVAPQPLQSAPGRGRSSSLLRPVPSVQRLGDFPEKKGAHFGVLLACPGKGTVTAQGPWPRPDLFLTPRSRGSGEGARVRGKGSWHFPLTVLGPPPSVLPGRPEFGAPATRGSPGRDRQNRSRGTGVGDHREEERGAPHTGTPGLGG